YAECLVSLAEKSFARRGLALAQSLIGQAKSTAQRLVHILDSNHMSRPRGYASALTFASAALALCIALASGTPKLVAFRDHAPVQTTEGGEVARAVPDPVAPAGTKIEANLRPGKQNPTQHRTASKANTILLARQKRPQSPELLARGTDTAGGSRTQFVVVMQTRIDGDGELRTNFCVWKLTLRDSDNRAIRAQIVAKSL